MTILMILLSAAAVFAFGLAAHTLRRVYRTFKLNRGYTLPG